jgi:hypothetical protein
MAFSNINAVEEVAIKFIVELSTERLAQVLGTRPQNLVWPQWRPLGFLLDHRLLISWWRCEIRVSVKVPFCKLDGLDLHSLDLLQIFLVVETIA